MLTNFARNWKFNPESAVHVDGLKGPLIDWLIYNSSLDWSIDRLIHSLIVWLIALLIDWLDLHFFRWVINWIRQNLGPNMTMIREEHNRVAASNSSPGNSGSTVILDTGHGTREIGRNNSMFERNNSTSSSIVRVSAGVYCSRLVCLYSGDCRGLPWFNIKAAKFDGPIALLILRFIGDRIACETRQGGVKELFMNAEISSSSLFPLGLAEESDFFLIFQ